MGIAWRRRSMDSVMMSLIDKMIWKWYHHLSNATKVKPNFAITILDPTGSRAKKMICQFKPVFSAHFSIPLHTCDSLYATNAL